MNKTLTAKKLFIEVFIGFIFLMLVMGFCALAGTQKVSLTKVFSADKNESGENIDHQIFFGVRVPRVVLAALVGAALASSGVVLQVILRNPLADPYILGISSGAGLGAIIAILSGITWKYFIGSPIMLFAFLGAIITVWLVWYIGQIGGKSQITSLLLAGVVVNAFFSAVIMFLVSIAKSEELRSTVLWLMGNITERDPKILWLSAGCIVPGIAALLVLGHKLNVLALGDEEAMGLGINPGKLRIFAFGIAAFITSVSVGLSGLIGFVGLIIPHGVRLIFGSDHRRLLPLSALTGGMFLVVCDTLARTVFGQEQLPVGVITAIAGGPFFLILLARYGRKVGWLK